jgi:ABC-type multidrug transport system fused ATPase/permease subunit
MLGSGKNTIVQLLERFYDVESEQILIDGVDIKEYALDNLRKSIGYAPQEPILFDTTIEENVKYGSEGKTRDEMREACEVADAVDFIMKDLVETLSHQNEADNERRDIGKGFERKVGAKGSLLSGEQK